MPDALASPLHLPGDFYHLVSPRGAVLRTSGTGFQVSMDDDTGADADVDLVRFSNIDPDYAAAFRAFSQQRLFTPASATDISVTFRVPGTARPAAVKGFGIVFVDVDVGDSATVEYFDERGGRLHRAVADASNNGLSFVGVSFDVERVARVEIKSGHARLSDGGDTTGTEYYPGSAWRDVVAMDDFLYGEPQAITEPAGLDTSFADGGLHTGPGTAGAALGIFVRADGKLLTVGRAGPSPGGIALVRLNPDGTRDVTYSGDGLALVLKDQGFYAHAAALQPDGKVVVAGEMIAPAGATYDFALVRVDADGVLDPSFGPQGTVRLAFRQTGSDAAMTVAVQPDGRIVAAGTTGDGSMAVARLLPDGTLDPSFNADAPLTPASGPGRLRFRPDDRQIWATAVAIQPDGGTILAGSIGWSGSHETVVLRLTPDGRLDETFGTGGMMTMAFGSGNVGTVLLLPDDRILLGMGGAGFAVARLLPDGTLDPSFNRLAIATQSDGNGRVTVPVQGLIQTPAMALQADGRLVLVGMRTIYLGSSYGLSHTIAVARVMADGVVDASFTTTGLALYDFFPNDYIDRSGAAAVAVQRDGRLVAAGHGNDGSVLLMRLMGGPTPGVYITTPTVGTALTAESPFARVEGTAVDDGGVTEVRWATDRGFAGTATGTATWAADVPLVAGANVITVTVFDAEGQTATDTLTVTANEFTYYLAEGATGDFFDLDLLLANPTETPAEIAITYLRPDGTVVPQALTLGAYTRRTVAVDEVPGLERTAVSAVVRSTNAVPLAVERTMRWDGRGYGGHTATAVEAPRTRWLFAEGNQGFFDTYVLLANANPTPTTATVTFLREGATPVTRTYDVAALTRRDVYAGEIPELANTAFSIVVTAPLPILAERAMYFGARLFEGGHASAGAPEAATRWFHAEGATGPYFDTYLLVGNPNAPPATLTLTYLTGDGLAVVTTRTVPARGRLTLHVDTEDPRLADTAVSATVVSDVPVVSERAMYWGGGDARTWIEAHDSFGVTTTATKWALAEGRVGGTAQYETFVLVANPSATVAQVRATFVRTTGPPVVRTYAVEPTSRFNIWVNAMVPELSDEEFGVLVEVLNDVGVVVERSMYWSVEGGAFAGGTNAIAVRVP